MPQLDFNLIQEIVSHGNNDLPIIDPSTSYFLREVGVARVTTYIEQLSLVDIIKEPAPIFGKDGGMWIGYKLTPVGRNLALSEEELKRHVAELIGGPKNQISEAVKELQAECEASNINENYKRDFLKTLEEISICFDNSCYIATLSLCGKILEVCLKKILHQNKIEHDPNTMIGGLLKKIREKLPQEYVDPSLQNIANIINTSRVTAIHTADNIPIPSKDQTIMVIFAMRDVVRRHLVA